MNYFSKSLIVAATTAVSVISYAQVRLQTGTPEIGFPLYQFNDAKNGLSTGVSLTYTGGNGIKVNDIASSVGTGWDLMVGGVIVRVQNGEPDDQKYDKPSAITWDPTDKMVYNLDMKYCYPNGYLYSTTLPQNAVPGNGAFTPLIPKGSSAFYKPNFDDREQDVFLFQFNGRSGKFVIGKDLSVLLIEDSRLKIEFMQTDMSAQNIRTRISEFSITDESGTKYVFSEREITENLSYGLGYGGFDGGTGGYVGYEVTSAVPIKKVDKWFLKEIVNPLNNKKITFNYEAFSLDYEGPRSVSTQESTQPNSTPRLSRMIQRIKVESKRLKNIVLPDGQKVSFVYSPSDRVDLSGDKYLERLDISYGDKLKYGYKFNYGYFLKKEIKAVNYNFPADQIRFARLCLLSFAKRISNNVSDKEHSFEYYLTDGINPDNEEFQGLPARFTYRSDYWGYYNAASNVEDNNGNPLYSSSPVSFGTYKRPHWSVQKIGLIKKIIYPTGGYFEYQYQNNLSINSGYGGNGFGGDAPGVHVSLTTLYDGISHTKDIIKKYRYANETGTASSLWGFEMPVASQTKNLRIYKSSTELFGATYSKESGTIYVANIGNTAFNLAVFIYRLNSNPYTAIFGLVTIFLWQLFAPDYKDYTMTTYFCESLLNKNPLPMLYSRVEVVEENETLSNGRTVYTFTDNVLYPITGSYSFPYSARPRLASWVYGLPKTIEWFDSSGNRLRKTENVYTAIVRTHTDNNYVSNAWDSDTIHMATLDKESALISSTGSISSDIYYPLTGRMELSEVVDTTYDNGRTIINKTRYTYTDDYQIRTVEKYNSVGGSEGITYYYPQDYPSTDVYPFVITMKNSNIFNVSIVTVSWLKESVTSGPKKTSKVALTVHDNISNGDVKPSQVYITEFEPLQDEVYTAIPPTLDPNVTNPFSSWRMPISYSYDVNGNVVQVNTVGKNKSAIYGYNGMLVTAEVGNAASDRIAYTSFEEDDKGNWSYSGVPVIDATAPTGLKTYTIDDTASQISKAGLSATTTYIVSYWKKSGSVAVNGTTPTTGNTINGWTYYEHKVVNPSGGTITVSGTNGVIDELRLYPADAHMTTYTYEPLIGVISQCDINNRIIYYEYDILGRLHLVRNQHKDILEKICYNYSGQPEDCQTYYYNEAKSGTFTRNNCGEAYNGSSVIYTVEANTHSSPVSKEAADSLALNDINTNGQAYANANGICTVIPVPVTLKNVGAEGNEHFYVDFIAQGGTAYTTHFNNVSLDPGDTYSKNVNWGTYNITIESKTGYNMVFSLNGELKTGSIVTYTNVTITGPFTIYAAAYENTTQNVTYTRNNCPSGYDPTSVVYVVAAGVYTSLISQADANTQAIAQTASAGQAYANANGLCVPQGPTNTTIVYTNDLPRKVTLTLTNVSTSVVYTFSLSSNTTQGTAGSVPAGYYNVKMHTTGPSDYYSIENYVQSIPDTDLEISNVPLLMPTTTVIAY